MAAENHASGSEEEIPRPALPKDPLFFRNLDQTFCMSDQNQSWTEKANALKDQAAEKLGTLKEKAEELADAVKTSAGHAWDKVNSPETRAQLDKLKDQAVEKLGEAEEKLQELGEKAKGWLNKTTGQHGSAQPGNTQPPENSEDPGKA